MKHEKTLAVLFGGIGGFSHGARKAKVEYGGQVYKYRLLVSIDCDPVACLNHDIVTGEKTAVVMDLFSRKQYIAFHGKEPPAGWREVTPWDIWEAFGRQVPNVVFLSPPCKGLSGLLSEESAQSEKYQALNELTVRGMELVLMACDMYGDGEVPDIIHFENVPRITSRGKYLLKQIGDLLKKYCYAVDMNPKHNLGEIGGLGQNRLRFLIMARQEKKIPNPIYLPQKKKLKSLGDIISPLPLPGDTDLCGWMHRIPRLQWKTWIRLALIPAGGDWRDLQRDCYANIYQVVPFDEPAPTVTGSHRPNNGAISVADPRINYNPRSGAFRVEDWDKTGPTITGSTRTGGSNGISGIADPRIENVQGYGNKYRISRFDEPAPTITGSRIGSGALAISDPRLSCSPRSGSYKVQKWEEPANTITSADLHSGSTAVSDPRIPKETESGVWMIIAEDGTWHRPLTTFELAMLQSFPLFLPDGRPFQLEGCSDAKAREYIGNAYPSDAAEATCQSTLMALAKADAKVEFELTNDLIWVMPVDKETLPLQIANLERRNPL
ncbi:DNA cytosine methyltransferase [Desulfosporosinus sp. SB140]|uniref:DNA cytosine methyltransferase n=1 Tax=Desulfosporosinus paludis TaxID=3115649 RepID=UPI00388D23F9